MWISENYFERIVKFYVIDRYKRIMKAVIEGTSSEDNCINIKRLDNCWTLQEEEIQLT